VLRECAESLESAQSAQRVRRVRKAEVIKAEDWSEESSIRYTVRKTNGYACFQLTRSRLFFSRLWAVWRASWTSTMYTPICSLFSMLMRWGQRKYNSYRLQSKNLGVLKVTCLGNLRQLHYMPLLPCFLETCRHFCRVPSKSGTVKMSKYWIPERLIKFKAFLISSSAFTLF
jgi:hypothetical protein